MRATWSSFSFLARWDSHAWSSACTVASLWEAGRNGVEVWGWGWGWGSREGDRERDREDREEVRWPMMELRRDVFLSFGGFSFLDALSKRVMLKGKRNEHG